jgi:hypothetical protein
VYPGANPDGGASLHRPFGEGGLGGCLPSATTQEAPMATPNLKYEPNPSHRGAADIGRGLGQHGADRVASTHLGRTPPPSWHRLPSPTHFTTSATPPVGPKRARLALQLLPTPGPSQTLYNESPDDWDWPKADRPLSSCRVKLQTFVRSGSCRFRLRQESCRNPRDRRDQDQRHHEHCHVWPDSSERVVAR